MDQQQFGVSLGGPLRRNRTFYFTNVERKVLDQTGVVSITPENVATINARLAQVGYQGLPVATGIYPEPRAQLERARQDRSSVQRGRSVERALRALRRDLGQRARRRQPERAIGIDRTRQPSTTRSRSATSGRSRRIRSTKPACRSPTATCEAYSTDQIGPQVTIAGVATFGTFSSSPTRRENTLYQAVSNLSHRAGAHALRAGVDFLFNDDTITFLRTFRGSYTFSSMANFLTGNYSGYAQTFGDPVVTPEEPERRRLRAGRVARRLAADAQRSAFATTCSSSRRSIPTPTTSRRGRASCGRRRRRRTSSCAAARASSSIGCRCAPWRTRCLSAGNTTDVTQLRQPQVSGILPTQAGAPVFPEYPARPSAVDGARVDHDDGQGSAERVLEAGEHRGRANARRQPHDQRRLSVLPRREPADVDQPERADVRGGGHQQRVPAGVGLHEQQPVSRAPATRTITACTSPTCSVRRTGRPSASATRCRSR